jgi:hypothetical protein
MELARRLRGIGAKLEYLNAGSDLESKLGSAMVAAEIDATYIRWGLIEIQGLTIDGEAATADRLIEWGPEPLAREVVEAVKRECCLSEDERKN